jgi:hypothetical protein
MVCYHVGKNGSLNKKFWMKTETPVSYMCFSQARTEVLRTVQMKFRLQSVTQIMFRHLAQDFVSLP